MNSECSCEKCIHACLEQPGWFAPGEAEEAAKFLGMEFEDFKNNYLVVDHCDNHQARNAPYLYAPRKRTIDPTPSVRPRTHDEQIRRGPCVFLNIKEGKCNIHQKKPYECRVVFACKLTPFGHRSEIEDLWMAAGAPLGMRPE